MRPHSFQRFMLDQISEGQIDWKELSDDYDNCVFVDSDGKAEFIPIWKNLAKFRSEMIKRYPKHEGALMQFFQLVETTCKGFIFFPIIKVMPYWIGFLAMKLKLYALVTNFFTAFHYKTLANLFQQLFGDDEEIKTVLGYSWGDYGVEPSRVGFGMLSLIHEHYSRGAFYPVGGASEIPYNIIPVIEQSGGKVLVNAKVTDILLDNNRMSAMGVTVDTSGGPVEIKAKMVISAAGVSNTFKKLLPKQVAVNTQVGRLLESGKIRSGYGSFQVFIGLKGSQSNLQLPNKNMWIYYGKNMEAELQKFFAMNLDQASDDETNFPFLYVAFPSAKDPTYNERFPDKSVITILTFIPTTWFMKWEDEKIKRRGNDYKSYKTKLARKCWERVCDLFPHLRDHLDYIDAGSPLSNQFYLNAFAGEAYGLECNTERFSPDVSFALRPQIREIDNFFLTGQDILTCGFLAALVSGYLTAHSILSTTGENSMLMADVKNLYVKCKKEALNQAKHN